jgi:hypothetical protein
MEKQFLPKTDFPFKSYDKKLVFSRRMGSFFPIGHKGKKSFYFLIHAVNFCKTFCACSPNSLEQDLTDKNAKNKIKIHLGVFELEMADLNVF